MRQGKTLTHEFVEFIPDVLKEGTLYVSMRIRDRGAQVLLRMRKRGRYPAQSHGLEAHF